MKLFVVSLFIVTYYLVLKYRNKSLHILFSSVLLLLIFKPISIFDAYKSINFNVLGVFLGTMALSSLFIISGVPAFIAGYLVKYSKRVDLAFLFICFLAGFISMFTENIATLFIVAPLALELAKKLNINPAPLLVGISISSNLQGSSTLIGDAPSIILATETNMTFNDFFWMSSRPGIFFAVQIGAVGSFYILYRYFKKYFHKPLALKADIPKVKSWIPAIFLSVMTLNLAILPLIKIDMPLSVICLFWAFIALAVNRIRNKDTFEVIKELDWHSVLFLAGIFVLVGSISKMGIIEDISGFMVKISNGNVLFAYIALIVFSVFISSFVDNIPYTIAMIPVAQSLALKFGVSQFPFLFGLLIGTCMGGNITPIGSASNVAVMGILRKNNHPIKISDFVKIGLPFTVVAVSLGSVFIWLVWMR